MRENGAYCVLALKNQGRVMFRFIDAPLIANGLLMSVSRCMASGVRYVSRWVRNMIYLRS